MITKLTSDNTFQKINDTVKKAYDFLKVTYGPSENKILLGKPHITMVIDDGMMSLKELELEDPIENEILKVIKEVCVRTNNRVGDGTTGAFLMAYALIQEIADYGKIDGKRISQDLKTAFEDFKVKLNKKAKQIKSVEDLEKVARVSFDNPKIARIIAELLHKVGHDGVIAIEESPGSETTTEFTEGLGIDKGYAHPYFVTNPERMEAILKNPYILVTDYRLTAPADLISLMEKILAEGRRELVIIAEHTEGDALATLIKNKIEGRFNVLAIDIPNFVSDKDEWLGDIATMTGATVISHNNGIKTSEITLDHLGQAEKVISKADKSMIIGGKGKKSEVNKTLKFIKSKIAEVQTQGIKMALQKRLAKLQNGVALIKVGAPTENELHALKYKVEDAVNATKVAYKSGVVRGAGIALSEIQTSSEILNKALKYPHKQLLENTGLKKEDIGPEVIDPVEVLISGVESAVSIVSLLVSTKRILVKYEEKKKE